MGAWPLLEAAIRGTRSDGCGSAKSETGAGSLAADLLQKQPPIFIFSMRLYLAAPFAAFACLTRQPFPAGHPKMTALIDSLSSRRPMRGKQALSDLIELRYSSQRRLPGAGRD
jgi:hypothetical protein